MSETPIPMEQGIAIAALEVSNSSFVAQRSSLPENPIDAQNTQREAALALQRDRKHHDERAWTTRFIHGNPILDSTRRWPDAMVDFNLGRERVVTARGFYKPAWSSRPSIRGLEAHSFASCRSARNPPLMRRSAPSPRPVFTWVRAGDLDTRHLGVWRT